jgi:hypothetical protein
MADNRRTAKRHDVDVACTFTVGDTPAAETRVTNLSVGGAFISFPRLPMGSRVHISFRVPTIESAISIGAVVRWATDEGVGIQFDGLRPKDVWALSKYLESLSR